MIGAIVIVAVMSVAAVLAAKARAERRAALAALAAQRGWEFSETDPFDVTRLGFDLFRKGDGRGAENMLWRNGRNELPVRAFDYWYYEEDRDNQGRVQRRYTRRSCVLAQVNGAWPDIVIARERLVDRVLSFVGLPDVELESEEFNRAFVVRCDDARFATALVDPQMMEFLLGTKGVVSLSMKGRWLLLETDVVKPVLVPALMALADEFIERIPRVVWELFPSPFFDADGKPLPAGDEHLAVERLEAAESASSPFNERATSPLEPLFDHLEGDGVDYDLDGKPVPKRDENPWGPPPA